MKYYDESLKTEFEIPEFLDIKDNDLLEFHQLEVHDAIYHATLLLSKYQSVPCMKVNNDILMVNIEGSDQRIEHSISYYAKLENYERCADLKKMKNLISLKYL